MDADGGPAVVDGGFVAANLLAPDLRAIMPRTVEFARAG